MIKTYAENDRYKVTDGYGPYMNKRFEVKEKYSYYDDDYSKKFIIKRLCY